MEMCYDGVLVMPSNYAVMDEEEMTYVEGGIDIPRAAAAMIIDGLFMFTPLGAAFAPFKYMGREAGKALVKKYAGSIAGKMGEALSAIGGFAGSFACNFTAGRIIGIIDIICSCATSFGGIFSIALDCMDKKGLDSYITLG